MKKSIWNSEDRNEFPNYNRMMQSIRFYKMFLKYEYMLLCQPDALILQGKKELKEFIKMGYDYIGGRFHKDNLIIAAPKIWGYKYYPSLRKKKFICGNGGLSLRKIESAIKLIRKYRLFTAGEEDIFFSYFPGKKYKVAPLNIAEIFALSDDSIDYFIERSILPFGLHKWEEKYGELRQEFEKYLLNCL